MIEVSEFRRGVCIHYKGEPMRIVDVTFSTPTARGSQVIAKTKLRNLITGRLITESIRAGDRYDEVSVEQRPVTYLYSDGARWHFLDGETYEQFDLGKEELGERTGFLVDGIEGVRAMVVQDRIVDVVLPDTVVLRVTEADPVIKGATAQSQLKRAVVETGALVQVPSYVVAGEAIRVDTRDGHFVERVRA